MLNGERIKPCPFQLWLFCSHVFDDFIDITNMLQ